MLFFVGTNLGRLATFKLLPESTGGYTVQLAGFCSLDDRIIAISPMKADTGASAYASQSNVANLRNGFKVDGVLLVTTQSVARIFKPASAKGAHKTWNEFLCDSAAVVRFEDQSYALVGLFGDGCARAYSVPGLKEISHVKVNHKIDITRFSEAVITSTGDIFGWTGPSEIAFLNVRGTGQELFVYQLPRLSKTLTEVEVLDHSTSCSMYKHSFPQDRLFPICNGSQGPNTSLPRTWTF